MTTTDCNRHTPTAGNKKNSFAALLGVAVALLIALGWPAESWGQTKLARVGILSSFALADDPSRRQWFEPFRSALSEHGWIEGKNLQFEYRSAENDPSRYASAAAELVALKVDVIWASSAPMVRAAYAHTRTVPIVAQDFTTDPIAEGYVESYGRPGGNVTGVFLDAPEFAGKWFELLKAMIPDLSRVVVLWDPGPGPTHLRALQTAARALGIQLQVMEVDRPEELDRAFASLRGRPQALIILPSPWIYSHSERLARLALKYRLPGTSMARLFAQSGGVVAYGPELKSASERSAALIAKILDGARPAELPVERPAKVQLVVNLKAAKTFGITIPESILLRADEVIR
jgi:putative ABC transport system substrate-binding protein